MDVGIEDEVEEDGAGGIESKSVVYVGRIDSRLEGTWSTASMGVCFERVRRSV